MIIRPAKKHLPASPFDAATKVSIPINDRFSKMMVSAVRYALGRRTYIVLDTVNYIKSVLPYLRRNDIHVTDIIEAEGEHRLGDECDVHDWLSLKEYIEDYVTGVIDDDKQ